MYFHRLLAGWIALVSLICAGALSAQTTPAEKLPAPRPLATEELLERLQQPAKIDAVRAPLSQAVKGLSQRHGIVIRLDEQALKEAGVAPNARVAIDAADATLNEVLRRMLGGLRLEHFIDDGGLTIAPARTVVAPNPEEAARGELAAAEAARERALAVRRAAVPAANAAARNEALEAQLEQQYQPLLTVELRVARRICRPSAEQSRLLAVDGEQAAKDAARACANSPRGAARTAAGIGLARSSAPDPRVLIQNGLVTAIERRLSSEAAAAYREDVEGRRANCRRAAVLNFVALLDRELTFSAEQRRSVHDALATQWKDEWCPSLEVFQYGGQYLPPAPDDAFLPLLSDGQREAWQASPRQRITISGFRPNAFGMIVAEE